jgi:dipeptidyl aminopeptidase/acylaminoacyl peptidase
MKVLARSLTLVLLLLASPAGAQQPITHEDVWLMKRLKTPVLSPDGRLVVVSVTEPAYNKDDAVSDLWLVPSDGSSAPRRLTSTPGSESDVAWSPDASRIAFTAKRMGDEEQQIYVLDMTGPGEARVVTSLSTGTSRPRWSPDGKQLAFESRVYPGTADDNANEEEKKAREERDYDASAYDGFPVRQWDHWRDDRRTHLFVQSVAPPGEARDLLAGTALAEERGYSGMPSMAADSLQAEWAPDGRSLVFVATTNRHEAAHAFTRYHLYRVPLEGAEPEPITRGVAVYEDPTFSPDGTALYASTRELNEYAYNLTRVVRFSWPECGEPEPVADGFDRSVSGFALAADGKQIFLLAADAGRRRIFSAATDGGDVTLSNAASRGAYAGLSGSRTGDPVLVARWEDSTHPAEIVRVDPESGEHSALTSFNAERAGEIDWQPYREMWFASSKGRRIHSWLTLPPGFDESKKYPLLMMIHGGPHASSLDTGHVRWDPQLMAAPGYVVLATDYTGSVGYGEAFARAIQGDPLKTRLQERSCWRPPTRRSSGSLSSTPLVRQPSAQVMEVTSSTGSRPPRPVSAASSVTPASFLSRDSGRRVTPSTTARSTTAAPPGKAGRSGASRARPATRAGSRRRFFSQSESRTTGCL